MKLDIDFARFFRHPPSVIMSDSSTSPTPLGEIVQGPSAFEQFLERNQRWLVTGTLAVALSLGGYVVYQTIQRDQAAEAGSALTRAKTTADFEQVSLKYDNTPAADTATLALAELQWNEGQQEAAIATLRKLIAKGKDHPAVPVAQSSLGFRLMSQGKHGEAEAAFQALLSSAPSSFLAPAALLALGDLAKQAGNIDQARSYYDKAQKLHADNSLSAAAEERIKLLQFQAPTEIEAPAATKTDDGTPKSIALPGEPSNDPIATNPLTSSLLGHDQSGQEPSGEAKSEEKVAVPDKDASAHSSAPTSTTPAPSDETKKSAPAENKP